MQVPVLFSVPRWWCSWAGALFTRHFVGRCRLGCLLAVEHGVGHFIQSVFLNPYHRVLGEGCSSF